MPDAQLIASRYRVLRELGRGGMGVVYIVEHVHTGDHVALKVLLDDAAKNPQAVERFKREARASARIKSEHIVKVIDADVAPELGGAPFLVMELLNGVDLQKQLEQRGRFPPDEALHYLGQVARALDKSHQMGIIHRDLKPENIFLHHKEDGTIILKILDFGISKLVGADANDIAGAGITKTGAIMGTPLYMSPEQARGRTSEIGPATDVWAMGLISMQLLTGEIYWQANTIAELMSQILGEPFYPPSTRWTSFGPAVDAWFMRSCARDPKARFASVGEQITALAAALGGGALVPVACASSPLVGLDTRPSAAALSGPVMVGARTSTSAIASDGRAAPASRGKGGLIAGGLVAVATVAGVGFFLHSRGLDGQQGRDLPAAASPSTTPATALPPADARPPATPDAAAPSPSAPTPSSDSPPSAPVASVAPAHGHGSSHSSSAAQTKPAVTNATSPVAATPQPPSTKPSPKPAATRYDPSGL
jgi:serine/threonine-protein kinase